MGWLTSLAGSTVGLDTAPLIYLIEKHPSYLPTIEPFFEALDRGDFAAVTSTITFTEVLVHPYRTGNHSLTLAYFEILSSSRNLAVVPVSAAIAAEAARLRASTGMKTPDALQLATAVQTGATSFLTNDSRLPAVPGIRLLILDRLQSTP